MSTPTAEVIVAVLGLVTMISARLLDWYFPLGRNKSRRQITKEDKNGDNL